MKKTLQYAPEDAEVEQQLHRKLHAPHIPEGGPTWWSHPHRHRVHSVGSRPRTRLQDEDTRLVNAFLQALQEKERGH